MADTLEILEEFMSHRHERDLLPDIDRGIMLALAERHIALAAKGVPDEAESFIEVDTNEYLDPVLFELEKRAIFERYPVVAGLTQDIPNPGDFLKFDELATPLFITRTRSGRVKAFVNGCRHRGTAIVTEEHGNRKGLFTCPYHGWSYDENGALAGVPCMPAFDGIDKTSLGLIEIPCEERAGIIWVSPRADVPLDLDRHLGAELTKELGMWRFDIIKPAHTGSVTLEGNWKLTFDTFMETYHFGVAHKNNLGIFYNSNVQTVDRYGKHIRISVSLKTIQTELAKQRVEDRAPENYFYVNYCLFPGMVFITNPQMLQLYRVFPKAVDKTVVHVTTYTRMPLETERDREIAYGMWRDGVDIVMAEDFPYGVMTAFRTMQSGALRKIVWGKNELALQLSRQNMTDAVKEYQGQNQ